MKRPISIKPLFFQLTTTFLVLYIIFMLLFMTKGGDRAGLITGLGLENSKTTYAIITIVMTIGLGLFFGLPIRIITSFRKWWIKNPILNISLLIIGLLLVVLSANSFFRLETISGNSGVLTTYSIANPYPVLIGWFLTAFSLLHFYPVSFLKWTNADTAASQTNKITR